MKKTFAFVLTVVVLPCWLAGCHHKKDAEPAPEPALTGQWKADSLHYTNYSLSNVVTSTGRLMAAPGTGLTIDAATITDNHSLTGMPTGTYTYARQGSTLTLTYPDLTLQRTLNIEALTDRQLQLSYVQVAGISGPTSLIKTQVFYSR